MLIDELKKQNMLALKEKDTSKRAVLSVVINKYMTLGYEAKANNKELTDADLVSILNKTLKELEEEKAGFLSLNRSDKIADIDYQMNVVKSYLPKMLSEEEIKNIILSLDDKSIPSVMKHFKMNYNGKCDMGLVNKVLRSI